MKHFKKINLGSGKDYKYDYINIDFSPDNSPDFLMDITNTTHWRILLDKYEGRVTEVKAYHILEHIEDYADLINIFKYVERLLTGGGKFVIKVPNAFHPTAFADPTHVRFFTKETFNHLDSSSDKGTYQTSLPHSLELVSITEVPDGGYNLLQKILMRGINIKSVKRGKIKEIIAIYEK